VVKGNSNASAPKPNNPLTPPVTPARNDEKPIAGERGGLSSSVSTATSSPFITAPRTMPASCLLTALGSTPSTRLTGTPA